MKSPKCLILFCCFVLITTTTFCQKNKSQTPKEPKILTEIKVLGKNLINGTPIEGIEYVFPIRIEQVFPDSINILLTVQLRDIGLEGGNPKRKGTVLQYDLKNSKILWVKEMDYYTDKLLKFDNLLIYSDKSDSYSLDLQKGHSIWEIKNYVPLNNTVNNNEMVLMFNLSEKDQLFGFDLLNQKLNWKRNISRKFGINEIFYIDTCTLMVVASGLHTININNGNGWDYTTITTEKYNSNSGAMIGGIMFGLVGSLLGALVDMAADPEYSTGYVSNVLVDSSFLYFASNEQIVKLDVQTGNMEWKYVFGNNLSSKSVIFTDDSMVYLVNQGYAIYDNKKIKKGKTSISAFDKQTGKRKYFLLIKSKEGYIYHAILFDNAMYLFFYNKIVKYNLETGTHMMEKVLKNDGFMYLELQQNNKFFTFNQNEILTDIMQDGSEQLHLKTDRKRLLLLDNQLNILKSLKSEELCAFLFNFCDYKLVTCAKKTFVINNEGKKIAELDVSNNAFIMDGVLYDKKVKSVVAIDLKEILK